LVRECFRLLISPPVLPSVETSSAASTWADCLSVSLSVSMTAVTDRQTDSHAAVSVHQTATSSTANGAQSQDTQMLHCVTARRSLLSQCHPTAAQEHAAFPLLICTKLAMCKHLVRIFTHPLQ